MVDTLTALPSMSINIQPNKWLTKDLLMLVTGLSDGKIRAFRRGAWRQGKEWILASTDGIPKSNSEALYNLDEINAFLDKQATKQPTV